MMPSFDFQSGPAEPPPADRPELIAGLSFVEASSRDSLSDIVLAFFVVDILEHRAVYDRSLSICDRCGRVGFEGSASLRRTCFVHRDPVVDTVAAIVARSRSAPRTRAAAAADRARTAANAQNGVAG